MSDKEYPKHIFTKDSDFELSWVKIDGHLFVHTNFKKFNTSVLERLRKAWIDFLIQAFFEGYEEIFTYTKDPRIVNIIGGAEEVGQDDPNLANLGLRMYKWDLR